MVIQADGQLSIVPAFSRHSFTDPIREARIVEPPHNLWEHLLEPMNKALQCGRMRIHQFAPLFGEKLQAAGWNRVGPQAAQFLGMLDQKIQDEISIDSIALGSGGGEAL